CHEFPRAAFDVNIRGTFNVLEACVQQGVKRLVYSSSASVYGDAVEEPMTEDHPFNNKNFYGATKIAGEAMARAFHHRYGLNVVGLRYMNVYGPRQDYRGAYIAVIMKMLDAIDRGEGPTILGDGSEAFDFVAVKDCGRANLCAMRADVVDSFYNVGTGKRTSLKELAEMLLRLTGSNQPIQYAPRSQATLVRNRIGSPKRAAAEIGFVAEMPLEQGLRELIGWRKAHMAEVGQRCLAAFQRHVRVGIVGSRGAHTPLGARPVWREAALLCNGRQHPDVWLRGQGAARAPGNDGAARSRRARRVSDVSEFLHRAHAVRRRAIVAGRIGAESDGR